MSNSEICQYLPWDSDFFGVKIARVNTPYLDQKSLDSVLSWCCEESIDCLYWLTTTDSQITLMAENYSFRMMDIRLTLELQNRESIIDVENYCKLNSKVEVRQAIKEDIPSLRAIAKISHHDSRFYADSNFSRALCDELYAVWIERSCQGYADTVFIAKQQDQTVGYISCHLSKVKTPHTGEIGLLAVSSQAQGQGVGSTLVNLAVAWFAQHDIRRVEVVTQGRNSAAQRLYQRCGFLTYSTHLWFHRWFLNKDASCE